MVYLISFPSIAIKSSQPQSLDIQAALKLMSPGSKEATRVEISVIGYSGIVSVAKRWESQLTSLKYI